MPDEEPLDVIASRILEVDGAPNFHIRIGRPKLAPENDCWFCSYELVGPSTSRRGRSGGVDAMQALILALNMLAVDVEFSEESEQGRLSWLESKDVGLPLPPVIEPPGETA